MELQRLLSSSLFIYVATVSYFQNVDSHVCIFKESIDPSTGQLRWSVPKAERCDCQRVAASPKHHIKSCDKLNSTELWFIDDIKQLINRKNWVKEKLDVLLHRDNCYTSNSVTTEVLSTKEPSTEVSSTDRVQNIKKASSNSTDSVTTLLPSTDTSNSVTTEVLSAKEPSTEVSSTTRVPNIKKASSNSTDSVTTLLPSTACEPRALGMESELIPDANITCSSYYAVNNLLPKYARLGSNSYWASDIGDKQPWIQTYLGTVRRVTELITKGGYYDSEWNYWVEEIQLKIGKSEDDLVLVTDDKGDPKVFQANSDPNNTATIEVDAEGVLTQFVRIYPSRCTLKGSLGPHCVMQFEIIGC